MDRRTALATTFTCVAVGAALAWTASDRFARAELARVLGGERAAMPATALSLGRSSPTLEPRHLTACELVLRIDPTLPDDLPTECASRMGDGSFHSLAATGYTARQITRLSAFADASGDARICAQLGRWNNNSQFSVHIAPDACDGTVLDAKGEGFSCLGSVVMTGISGTLTLRRLPLEPGSALALKLDLEYEQHDGIGRDALRASGVVRVESAVTPAK